ncbi:MAG: urease accessory protein UreE [Thiotrichales bacterium]|nr:urease accessory protein UreE [Thiotrichales bacterium]
MRAFTQVMTSPPTSQILDKVTLTFHQREKSRLKVILPTEEEIGLFLPRGTVLKAGDVLTNEEGDKLEVVAASETVSTIKSDNSHLLLRIAYHLGNRHVPLQVETEWLRYAHDHVLDDMVRLLGGEVLVEQASLHPESGAYGGGHSHHHDHEHGEAHSHSHHH